jgi:uncharacterized protein (TIGR01777 family)
MTSLRVAVAGSSGFLGTHLTDALIERGHAVTALVRKPTSAPDESHWDPYADRLDQDVIENADVVVNLGGSRMIGNAHSKRWRDNLYRSRVTPTRVLAEAIAASSSKPAYVAANASAWYGDHGAELVTEQSGSRGDSFMTQVARDWQDATTPAAESGARVCLVRTVPVMHPASLTMKVLLPMFRLGLGTRLGDGSQYFPVVSLRDWVAAAAYLVETPSASGPFNVSCPDPPTNREFTDALASALGRKARLAAPAVVLKMATGRLAPETLGSFRLVPAALEAAGFTFRDRNVEAVLASGLR